MLPGSRSLRRVCAAGGGIAATLALLASAPNPHPAILVWNASASAPIGLYGVIHSAPRLDDLVLVQPPPAVAAFAAARGYLPLHVLLVKRIAAVGGARICASGNTIFIDGSQIATRRRADSEGRVLPGWQGCHTLHADEVFLLMKGVSSSFDARYFGAVSRSSVTGRLIPIWTR